MHGTVVLPNFMVKKFCGNEKLGQKLCENLHRLCVTTKFPHQEVMWNLGALRYVSWNLDVLHLAPSIHKMIPEFTVLVWKITTYFILYASNILRRVKM